MRDVMAQKVKKIFSFPSSLRGACPVARFSKMNFIAMILPRCYGGTTKQNFEIEQGDQVGIIGRNGQKRTE